MMALERLRAKKGVRRRRPDPARFAAVTVDMPCMPPEKARRNGLLLAALVLAGTAAGGLWPQETVSDKAEEDDIFVMEEELPPPPPPPPEPPPPPPMPEPPPKVEPPPEPEPPPPQFGLEEGDLSEAGDLAVATGNTIMKEAEEEVAPPPPPLPPSPVMMDQPPRILKGEPPEYPARALDRGLEGTVVALITIDTNGIVTDVSVEKSAGVDFDRTVMESARKTRFQPPVRNGRRMPARFRRPYEFRLE
jgi:protein TonB